MEPTRRAFLRQAACAALGTTSLASTYWNLRSLNAAAADNSAVAAAGDYKALVCIFLFGGNDGNNMLVPVDNAGYAQYVAGRPAIALPQTGFHPLTPATYRDGRSFGLHPSMPEMQGLFNQGQAALVCNVGTLVQPVTRDLLSHGKAKLPPQLFSHQDQQIEWQTSWPDAPPRSGWGGRLADLLASANGNSQFSMSISLGGNNTFQVGNAVAQFQVSPYGPVGFSDDGSAAAKARNDAINQMLALPYHNLFESTYAHISEQAVLNNQLLSDALPKVNLNGSQFPQRSYLADQLKMVANLISLRQALGQRRQIFFCAVGGYDTHDHEVDSQTALLQELSQGMAAFYQATANLGVANQVTTFTASDFGRTFIANDSGSDHGWGNHHFVMGGAVRGGDLYGRYPVLEANSPDDWFTGRWIPSTSVDQYSATLAKWFGVGAGQLATVLPNIGNFPTADLGFMTA